MNVKNLVLGIGIVIVYALVLWQGIEAFHPSPQYENFCTNQGYFYGPTPVKTPTGEVNCTLSPTPQQQNQCASDGGNLVVDTYDVNECPASFKCDFCNKEWTESRNDYAQTLFVIALIVGIITLVVGYFMLRIEPVGSALMASGIWAILYGSIWNWSNLSSVWRFVLLLISLVLLIWITIRLNRQKKGFFNFKKKK